MEKRDLGMKGEDCAAHYLKYMGYEILERNFRCRYGEIDIVALDGDTLCFVEVKTRSRTDYGLPCQAVDRRKILHIKRCAYVYLRAHEGLKYGDVRIDIVEVIYSGGGYSARLIINGRDG